MFILTALSPIHSRHDVNRTNGCCRNVRNVSSRSPKLTGGLAKISRRCYRRLPIAMKTCTVTFSGPSGVRHSVEVSADSLYEAAIVGFSLLKNDGWVDPIASGTRLEIQVRHPATTHSVSLAQLRRWVEGIAVSPGETLRKRKLKELLAR
jgi:hypothetical protein